MGGGARPFGALPCGTMAKRWRAGGVAMAWVACGAACVSPPDASTAASRASATAAPKPLSADAAACDAGDGAACERVADASVRAARAAGLGVFAMGSKEDRELLDRVCTARGISGACVALARILPPG